MKRLAPLLVAGALLAAGCTAGARADAPLPARLDERLAAWAERGGVPAATVVVRRAGDEVWRGGHATPDDTQMRVASITKLFVATVAMQLVEDGALALDAPLPPATDRLLPVHGLTLRQLLNHTSGLPDYGAPEFSQGLVDDAERTWTEAEVLATLRGVRPGFPAGRWWEYSNTNYVAVAAAIAEVTGSAWHELLRARILEPLGLDDTYVAAREPARGPGLVDVAYFDLDNDGQYEDVEDGAWPALETSEGAAGAIVSTAADVARFTEALFAGEIVSRATVREMVTPVPYRRPFDAYGLGVELRRPDLQTLVWGHGGFLPGYRSVTWFVPSTGITVTVLANHALANPADLAELLHGEIVR